MNFDQLENHFRIIENKICYYNLHILYGNKWLDNFKKLQNDILIGQKILLTNYQYLSNIQVKRITKIYTLINEILNKRSTNCKANLESNKLLFKNEDINDINLINIILQQQELLLQQFKLKIEIQQMQLGLKSFNEIEKKYPKNGYFFIDLVHKNYFSKLLEIETNISKQLTNIKI